MSGSLNDSGNVSYSHVQTTVPTYNLVIDKVIGYMYFTICFVGTISNAMMLAVIVAKFLKKKFNPTSIIMLQLCFTDLIGCAIQAPVVCYALVRGREFNIENAETYAIFCNVFGFLSTLLPLLSIYLTSNLCFIRFIGVHYVFSSKRIMTLNKALLLSFLSWTVPILCALMPFYMNNNYVYAATVGAFYMQLDHLPQPILTKLAVNLIITVPFTVTVVCCVLVVLKLRRNTQQTRQLSRMESLLESPEDRPVLSRTISRNTSCSKSSPEDCHGDSTRDRLECKSTSSRDCLREKLRDPKSSRDPRERQREGSRESKPCSVSQISQVSHVHDTDSSTRASVTIAIITAAFIIAYGPYMILWVYNLLTFDLGLLAPLVNHGSKHWYIYLYVYLISTNVLSTFNSCIFPLIYFVRVKRRLVGTLWAALMDKWALLLAKSDGAYHKYAELELQEQAKLQGILITSQ